MSDMSMLDASSTERGSKAGPAGGQHTPQIHTHASIHKSATANINKFLFTLYLSSLAYFQAFIKRPYN